KKLLAPLLLAIVFAAVAMGVIAEPAEHRQEPAQPRQASDTAETVTETGKPQKPPAGVDTDNKKAPNPAAEANHLTSTYKCWIRSRVIGGVPPIMVEGAISGTTKTAEDGELAITVSATALRRVKYGLFRGLDVTVPSSASTP